MTSIRVFNRRSPVVRAVVTALCAMLVAPGDLSVLAQSTTPQATPQATPTANPTAGDTDYVKLTNDQLDALVAPVALYPDPLLSQSLVASTYPLELVQAQQWVEKNKKMKKEELEKAVQKEDWDPSVQATALIPDLLKRLTEDITWTHNLGNAFLEQQSDVMDAVQRLRAKAKKDGKLDSSEQQKVETKTVESKTVIEIQPTSTEVVYVPAYSPTVIWGPMYYPYPPIYYPPYYGGAWIGFGVGIAVGIGISGGWGWGCGWGGNNVYINHHNTIINNNNIRVGNTNIGSGNTNWNHNPSHRGGAPYASQNSASKFSGQTRGGAAANRPSTSATSQGLSNRAGSSSLGSGNRAGSTSAGGDRAGSRSIPSSSSRSSGGLGGMSSGAGSASRAGSASSRGGGSMGGSRGGGGGRR